MLDVGPNQSPPGLTLGSQEVIRDSRLGPWQERHEGQPDTPRGSSSDRKAAGRRTSLASDSAASGVSGSRIENKLSADSVLCLTRKEK